ncbi:ATP-binding cassette domain-containing protein [Paenibacillus albidus]|uniref:ATP-binding cassette domain-containing protein n=1 Tax=Paenibacillus albidus TaxID=2041023 RepID=UPI001BEC97F9|nr:ATP-binding cassette domain-containing protein [Paenibacillus albidus]MBT2291288.1 ATP-binding cassette domain-containing protein [Paenibacillus albidus]
MRIQLENVSYQYDRKPALHGICLNIEQGSLTVLCGVTGSGKSTLLRLIAGLEQPDSGSISCGENEEESARPIAAMVFQQPETQLFAGTVYKDIEYGLEQHGVPKALWQERVRSALAQVGLPYESYSRRSPFLLSGGEKRRVCIAGAIAAHPGLLVLDEPTAGLDPPAAAALLDKVQQLRADGLTIVIGTHDLDSFLPIADKVVVLSQGAVCYSGPVDPLNADPGPLYAAGLTAPAYIRIGRTLRERGRLEPQHKPRSLDELLGRLRSHPLPIPGSRSPGTTTSSGHQPSGEKRLLPPLPPKAPEPETAARTDRWLSLDPRVKWLGMALGSIVILRMGALLPLLLATAMIGGLLLSAEIPWKRMLRFFRPFLVMFLFLWLLSALSWDSPDFTLGPLGFSGEGFLQGGLAVLRFLLLIAIGFLFTETTTGAPLREGLEWAIAPLERLGIRTRNWSLAISITLQFVPWILERLAQLQLALRSRGRQKGRLAHWTPRQISLLIVPLLILVISMGDELATAIESRGYDPRKKRTPSYVLVWHTRDTIALVCIVLSAAVLWVYS